MFGMAIVKFGDYMKWMLCVFSTVIISGCAKEPSDELVRNNQCYEQMVSNRLAKINGLITSEDEIDIRIAEDHLRKNIQDWMLKYQQANDITDPVGGLSSAFYGMELARDATKASWKDLYVILSRPTVDTRVSEYVSNTLLSSFKTCYGTIENQ
ncbi:hypothetical protein CCZ37_16075 [Vibrio qinghaiensis]|uniref:Uncharacterized protein n=2 Tax=Vibrio qinghaiensis TaxID=2025808 RepID=A0A223N2M0_9VIBR|nr:hypothetical protein CCZ37_16075 [Vibrio qinghaiensis]